MKGEQTNELERIKTTEFIPALEKATRDIGVLIGLKTFLIDPVHFLLYKEAQANSAMQEPLQAEYVACKEKCFGSDLKLFSGAND